VRKRDVRPESHGVTRRRFLGRLGAGAAGAAALGTAGNIGIESLERVTAFADPSSPASSSPLFFGRAFPDLPAFAPASDTLAAAPRDIGKPGGYLDAKDNLAAGSKSKRDPTRESTRPGDGRSRRATEASRYRFCSPLNSSIRRCHPSSAADMARP
jgi:hypothetical protein